MATVTVEINGKETVSDAAKKASGGLKDMEEGSKGLGLSFTDMSNMASMAVGAIQEVISQVGEFVTTYADQQKSLMKFDSVMARSEQFQEGAAQRLSDFAGDMGLRAGIDDEAIKDQISLLAAANKTEEEIEKIIKTATDFALVSGTTMESAVQTLMKVDIGSIGRMAPFAPVLKVMKDDLNFYKKEITALRKDLKKGDITSEQFDDQKSKLAESLTSLRENGGVFQDAAGKFYLDESKIDWVGVVAEQIEGLSDDLSGSLSTSLGNLGNVWEDTQAALGQTIAPVAQPIIEGLVAFLNDTAIPAIQYFVPVVQGVVDAITAAWERFRPAIEPILEWFGAMFSLVIGPNIKAIGDIVEGVIGVISGLMTGDWTVTWNGLQGIAMGALDIIKNAFAPITLAAESVWATISSIWTPAWTALKTVVQGPVDAIKAFFAPLTTTASGVWTGIKAAWDAIWIKLQEAVRVPVEAIKAFFAPVTETVQKVIDGIDKALQFVGLAPKDDAPKWKTRREGNYEIFTEGKWQGYKAGEYTKDPKTGKETYRAYTGYAKGTKSAAPGVALVGEEGPELVIMRGGEHVIPNDNLMAAARALGIRGYAQGTIRMEESGGTGEAAAAAAAMAGASASAGDFGAALGSAALQLESVSALYNWQATIISAAMEVLGPVIDSVLKPLVGVLKTLGYAAGQMLVPLVTALTPIIIAVTKLFVWLYNLLLPVFNFIVKIFNVLANAISAFVKWITAGLVDMGTRDVNSGQLQAIAYEDVEANGTLPGSGSSGSNASYQKPRDLTVNVEVTTAALVGDGGISEFALIIGRELRASGLLNVT